MEELWQVEANIDDMNPQYMEYIFERMFSLGVNDVWAMPMMMKKCRMATMLCVLCKKELIEPVMALVFKETTSIGARYFPVMRKACARVMGSVDWGEGIIHIKICRDGAEITNISAEYDDCRALAVKTGHPIKEIQRKALEEAYRQYEYKTK